MKKILEIYFNSTWIPIVVYIIPSMILSPIYEESYRFYALILFVGILFSGVWNAYKKRWLIASPNLFFSIFILVVAYMIMG